MDIEYIIKEPCPECRGELKYWNSNSNYRVFSGIQCTNCNYATNKISIKIEEKYSKKKPVKNKSSKKIEKDVVIQLVELRMFLSGYFMGFIRDKNFDDLSFESKYLKFLNKLPKKLIYTEKELGDFVKKLDKILSSEKYFIK